MIHPERESYTALLTPEEVGVRLRVPVSAVNHLVETGDLKPVHVAGRGNYRFWPDEIMAYGLRETIKAGPWQPGREVVGDEGTRIDLGPELADLAPLRPPRGGLKNRLAWPPFTAPTPRPAYLAFADREHVERYLRLKRVVSG